MLKRMMILSFLILLLLPNFVKAGSYYPESTFSTTKEMFNQGKNYEDIAIMKAAPMWKKINLNKNISISIPQSPKWKINGKILKPIYEERRENNEEASFSFGRFVSNGTYMLAEYILIIENRTSSLKQIRFKAENQCPTTIAKPPKFIKLNEIRGVSYLSGGAKGCTTVFTFMKEGNLISLRKKYDIGKDDLSHEITPEMRTIIKSIDIKK